LLRKQQKTLGGYFILLHPVYDQRIVASQLVCNFWTTSYTVLEAKRRLKLSNFC